MASLKGAHRYLIDKTHKRRVLDVMMRVMRDPVGMADWMPADASGIGKPCWKARAGKVRILFDLDREKLPVLHDIDFRKDIYAKERR